MFAVGLAAHIGVGFMRARKASLGNADEKSSHRWRTPKVAASGASRGPRSD
jgi:hypothetical protein